MIDKPFAPAAERNAPHILAVIAPALAGARRLLEIGSGTGQHAVRFAEALPHLIWQTSDRAEQLPAIRAWLKEASRPNLPPPLALEIGRDPFPPGPFDALFTANTLHYMPWAAVEALLRALPQMLGANGQLIVYGPFRVGGAYVSPDDPAFDAQLRAEAPWRGLRDFEAVDSLVRAAGAAAPEVHPMPRGNRCAIWRFPAERAVV